MLLTILLSILSVSVECSNSHEQDRGLMKRERFLAKISSALETRSHQRKKRSSDGGVLDNLYPISEGSILRTINFQEDENAGCQLRKMEINFDELGWTHIFAPKKIEFGYCHGSCEPATVGPRIFTTSAAQALFKLHLRGEPMVDYPCCCPSSFAPLDVLVYTQPPHLWNRTVITPHNQKDLLELVTIPDVITTSCGCN